MPRRSMVDQELGFVKAFWDELHSLEVDNNCIAQVNIVRSGRRGVILMRITVAVPERDEMHPPRTYAVQGTFPNGSNQTLAAWQWELVRKLNDMVYLAVSTRLSSSD